MDKSIVSPFLTHGVILDNLPLLCQKLSDWVEV